MNRARWWHVTGCVFGGRLVSHTLKASTPEMARKKVRAKYKRGAFAGYSLLVRETVRPDYPHWQSAIEQYGPNLP